MKVKNNQKLVTIRTFLTFFISNQSETLISASLFTIKPLEILIQIRLYHYEQKIDSSINHHHR